MSPTPGTDIDSPSSSSPSLPSASPGQSSRGAMVANLGASLVNATAVCWIARLVMEGRLDPLKGLVGIAFVAAPTHVGQLVALGRRFFLGAK